MGLGITLLTLLQWGHRLSVVETILSVNVQYRKQGASMGPPPFGGGNGWRLNRMSGCLLAFNGATAFRWWKLGQGLEPGLRPFVPSMGPPPSGGGNYLAVHCRRQGGNPSMGPPPFGGGNRLLKAKDTISGLSLQWGHRLSVVETISKSWALCGCTPPFNGATAFRWWKHQVIIYGSASRSYLQWGHRLSVVETPAVRPCAPTICSSFNGATAFRWWKRRCQSGAR